MKRSLFFLFASMLIQQIAAQGTITGKVTDAATGDILLGATVILESNSTGTSRLVQGRLSVHCIWRIRASGRGR